MANVILVADDDLYIRSIFEVALGELGQLIEAPSGDNVLALYKKHNPDVTFMDLHLPGKNGQKAMQEILDYDESAFVVMMSADAVSMVVQKATNAGAKGFIIKPFVKETLLKYLRLCPTFHLTDGEATSAARA
ncbi:MAG: response regulator [Alphaproteobacteria bacterium]|nr:response regulator [Alphaproteobacteria bacterium]